MIAILQFDCVSLPHFHRLLGEGRLPTLARLRADGEWLPLETPALPWEGATYFTLYGGEKIKDHGNYFSLFWVVVRQRARPQDELPAA